MRADGRLWLALVLVGCVIAAGSAWLPFIHDDDPFYAQVAKNVVATGDWITLRHQAYAQVDKPPLTIWLMAASMRIAGERPVAFRVWHILMTLALAWTTYRLARRGAGPDESRLAALVVLTSVLVQQHLLMPQQDIPLALFLALGFLAYYDYRRWGRLRDAALAGLWIAWAMLTKGLVGPALFGLVVAADIIAGARRERGGHWHWAHIAVGGVVFLAVAAPWFVAGAMRQGVGFVHTFLLGRMGIGRAFQPTLPTLPYGWALLYYVPMVILSMVPWTGTLPAVVRDLRRDFVGDAAPLYRLCRLWAVLIFLALSIAPTDRGPRYLLLILPPLAVLVARVLIRALDNTGEASRRSQTRLLGPAAISLLLGLFGAVAGVRAVAAQNPAGANVFPLLQPAVLALSAGLIAGGLAFTLGRVRAAIVVLAAGALIAQAAFIIMATRHWDEVWPWRAVAAAIVDHHRPGDRVFVVGEIAGERNFAHYYFPAPVQWVDDDDALARAWTDGTAFALVAPHFAERVRSRFSATILYRMPSGWIVVTNRSPQP